MLCNQNILTCRLQIIKRVTKEMRYTKLYAVLMISVILVGIFSFSPVIALLFTNLTISSSGKIVSVLPLHVEGRYIKNSLNQTVLLRGVNKVEFADDPDGTWMGSTLWTDENVEAELDAMKSWGVNTVRCHFSVELWKYDIGPDSGHPASPYCRISAREAMKRLAQFAAERGMYVIYDAYTVKCYWSGCDQDPLPFPPYQTSPNASNVIANVSEFVEFWRSVARELKDYPNVIFEIWNEPCNSASSNKTSEEAFMDWMNAWNLCVDAIREEGATQPVIFQWGMGVYCNLYEDPQTGEIYALNGYTLHDWLENAKGNLTDPLNNVIYSTHVYRLYGGTGLYQGSAKDKYGSYGWVYEHIRTAFEYEGFVWAQETMKVPLFIGEVGCDIDWTGDEYTRELAAWNNTLSLFHGWGIHYCAFWWRSIGVFRLHTGAPNFDPTTGGEILKKHLFGT